jgi:hypothetical protein
MSGHEDDTDLRDSDGGMGVSSERTGPTGPGQDSTTGVRDVSETDRDDATDGADVPPEQATGGAEVNPDGLEPKAGYPSLDPRSD